MGVDRALVHTALLSGLLSHLGTRLEPGREYLGARGTRFTLWPGSALARGKASLVVAAELVETSRLWGRLVAPVDPAWVEQVGGDLLRRNYSEPRWDPRRGAVLATERVTLLGVTLFAARTVQFDRIDPALARELFIRHALVEGDVDVAPAFLSANQAALDRAAEHERRARRQDVVIDDDALFALYDARIPAEVTSMRHLESWWRKASRTDPELMTFTEEVLIAAGAALASAEEYPDEITSGGVSVGLDYVFDPGAGRRRGVGHGAAGRAAATRPDRLRPADPRHAKGSRDRADPLATEDGQASVRSGARFRRCGTGQDRRLLRPTAA